MMRPMFAFAALALLAACDKGNEKGTDISISGTDSQGKPAVARLDGGTGRVTLDVPGVKLDLPLPKVTLNADDFDIGGVALYPGSTVNGLHVLTDKAGGSDDAVNIRFDSPAAPATVAAWFAEKMRQKGFTLTADGTSLSGKTEDGDPFTLRLTPGAAGHSSGVIDMKS